MSEKPQTVLESTADSESPKLERLVDSQEPEGLPTTVLIDDDFVYSDRRR